MAHLDFHALFHHAADGILVVDASFRVIDVNDAFARMVGVDRASLIGRDPTELITSTDRQLLPVQRARLAREGSLFSQRRLMHADGTEIPVEIRSTSMPDGTVLGIVWDVRHRPLSDSLRADDEMVRQLRVLAPDVPVVFVSGYTADDRDLPLDDRTVFVPKPYSIDTLCDAIDSLLAG